MTISDCQSPGAHCSQERTLEGVPGEFLYIKKAPPSQLGRGNISRTPLHTPRDPGHITRPQALRVNAQGRYWSWVGFLVRGGGGVPPGLC